MSIPEFYHIDRKTFDMLRAANVNRARRWHGPHCEPWTGADWSNAMAGEAGEVCDAVKKMRRLETRIVSNNPRQPSTIEDARRAISKEIGDTLIYLDLLAAYYEINLAVALQMTFNAISTREGFPEMLTGA
jgi:NTP pyrophosphatase (non-canonical NTP hydrolase)